MKRSRPDVAGCVRGGGGEKPAGRLSLVRIAAIAAILSCCGQVRGQPASIVAPGIDPRIGAAQFPDDDAVILRWAQHWTLEKDGTVRRRDHKRLKLLNVRPIRAVADPRLDYCVGEDELTIHTARTILPDGKVLPVPDYSFNKVGPNDVAGWPEHANWEQTVVSFSGLEPGCVLELDYEVATRPGVLPWLEADLRIDDDYPIVERTVTVTVPAGTGLNHRLDNLSPASEVSKQRAEDGETSYRWTFSDLPANRAEPQSLPWRQRCVRLRFTTGPKGLDWVSTVQRRVDNAASASDGVRRFAEAAVGDETAPLQRVRKVATKLRDTLNSVTSWKTTRALRCRNASEVLQSNHGSALESGALLVAALRSLGLAASVEVAVQADTWSDAVPTLSALSGIVAAVDLPDGAVRVHPQAGVIKDGGHWGRAVLMRVERPEGSGRPPRLLAKAIRARGQTRPSELQITGRLALDGDGSATGDLRIHMTGAFYDPRKLETAAEQETFVRGVVGRLAKGFDVTGHSIVTLSDETLKATVKVASSGVLENHGMGYVLEVGDGPLFLADFPMPLGRSYRKTDVRLAGRFREDLDLIVTLPVGRAALVVPTPLPRRVGKWGTAEQTVDVNGRDVRIRRQVATTGDTFSPDAFASLREAVNDLRAAGSRMLVVGLAGP